MARILVIDDETMVGRTLARVLDDWDVAHVETVAAARAELAASEFDAVLCDWQIGPDSGLEVWRLIESQYPALCARFAFMTGSSPQDQPDVATLGRPVLRKPFSTEELRAVLTGLG